MKAKRLLEEYRQIFRIQNAGSDIVHHPSTSTFDLLLALRVAFDKLYKVPLKVSPTRKKGA